MKLPFRTLDDVDCANKRVLIRGDLNVPVENGVPSDVTRIQRLARTVAELSDKKAKVIVLSHFGRPKSNADASLSLKPIADALGKLLSKPVAFANDCIGPQAEKAVAALQPGEVLVLENTRFHKGEEANEPGFVKELAKLGDIYVNDAFSVAHRAHATTEGLAHVLPAVAGRDMEAELEALATALEQPVKPVMALVGGSKISTKIDVLKNLTSKVDVIALGGGMANTFLAAEGINVGASLCENDMLDTARAIMANAKKNNCRMILPEDFVVVEKLEPNAKYETVPATAIPSNMRAVDVGPKTVKTIQAALEGVKTLMWNGPLGVFEVAPFGNGTKAVAEKAAQLTKAGKLLSVAGGGDTVAILNMAKVVPDFTYVSIAGGAFLEWLEGRALPGVEALRKK
jgi:phosphoglycerate kinase